MATHASGIAFYDYSRGLDFWSWLNLPQVRLGWAAAAGGCHPGMASSAAVAG